MMSVTLQEVNFTTTAQGSGVTETASAAATINFTDYIRLSSISGKDLWFSYATDDDPELQPLPRIIRQSVVLSKLMLVH